MINILKNRTFLLFFSGNIISLIGFGFNLIAISWLVLDKTGSEIILGKIIASATIPGLVIAIFTGYIIDKMNRKYLLVILDIFRIFIITMFLLYLNFYDFKISLLYPVVFLMGIGNSLFWSTAQAFTQEIVSRDDYFNANKLLSASYQIGSIIGAALGGFIVHIFDPFVALWINVLTYIISGVLIYLAPYKYSKKNDITNLQLKTIFKGFVFLKKRKDISFLSMTTVLSDVAIWGSLSVLTISISIEIFNKGSWGYGVLDGFYGIGALLSVFFLSFICKFLNRKNVLLICYFLASTSLMLSIRMPNIYIASLFFLVLGLNSNSGRIMLRTILMENINNDIMGRVQTVLGVYTRLMVVMSSLICGYLIESYSINYATYFTAIHYALAFLGIILVRIIFSNSSNYLIKKQF